MSLVYRGTSSDDVHFNVTERRVYNAPAFDVSGIEVPGRSGDILNSQERFKNKSIVYTGFIRSSDFPGDTTWERLSKGLRTIKAWACGDAGKYHDLTDDYDPGFVRRAFVSGETAISEVLDRPDGATITITFMAEPFMYEESDPIELPETGTASGAIASFEGVAAPLQSLVFSIEPKQSGSGDPSPSNIRPISGWTQVDGVAAGVNLLDFNGNLLTSMSNGLLPTANSDGTITLAGTTTQTWGYLTPVVQQRIKPGTYTLSRETATAYKLYVNVTYDDGTNKNIEIGANATTSYGVELTKPVVSWRLCRALMTNNTAYNETFKVMLSLGSTNWEKYSGTPITISLGQTVYGGTVDALSGKCYARPYYASYSGQALVGPWISSHDKYVAGGTPTTGAQVVDMGGTETTLSITPVSVSSLLGQNNIWANTGDTEVVYVDPTENPTEWPSKPRLEITMSGAGTLTVNGKTWSIGAYTGTLICDSEIMDWYDASNLKNSLVSGDGFPELQPGENVITYTGGITNVVAKPRWRTL